MEVVARRRGDELLVRPLCMIAEGDFYAIHDLARPSRAGRPSSDSAIVVQRRPAPFAATPPPRVPRRPRRQHHRARVDTPRDSGVVVVVETPRVGMTTGTYFERLAAKSAVDVNRDSPPRDSRASPGHHGPAGRPKNLMDPTDGTMPWAPSAYGRGDAPLPVIPPRLAPSGAPLADAGVQCAPSEATRFYLLKAERAREGQAARPFVRADFDVVDEDVDKFDKEHVEEERFDKFDVIAAQEHGLGAMDDREWRTMADYDRVDYDVMLLPPGRDYVGHPPRGFGPLAPDLKVALEALDAAEGGDARVRLTHVPKADVAGTRWSALNGTPTGVGSFDLDLDATPPTLTMKPELKAWLERVARMRPRAKDDRGLLAKLQGAAIAHVIRELESTELGDAFAEHVGNSALSKSAAASMSGAMAENETLRARIEELELELKATREVALSNQVAAQQKFQAEMEDMNQKQRELKKKLNALTEDVTMARVNSNRANAELKRAKKILEKQGFREKARLVHHALRTEMMQSVIEEKDKSFRENELLLTEARQEAAFVEHEKLDTSFLLWAVENHMTENYWAVEMCRGMHNVILPKGCAVVMPLLSQLFRKRYYSNAVIPAGSVIIAPPKDSPLVALMQKGKGGGGSGSSRLPGVEMCLPANTVIDFEDGEDAHIEIPGGTKVVLPSSWLPDDRLYEVRLPIGTSVMLPEDIREDADEDGADLAYEIFMHMYKHKLMSEDDDDFYVDAAMIARDEMEKRNEGEETMKRLRSRSDQHESANVRRMRHNSSASRHAESAMKAKRMAEDFSKNGKQFGVACVTLWLPPNTRIGAVAGGLNHVFLPSGCTYYFSGNGDSFVPPGAIVRLASFPSDPHHVMLSHGTIAKFPGAPGDAADGDDAYATSHVDNVILPGGAEVMFSRPGKAFVPQNTVVRDQAGRERVNESFLEQEMRVDVDEVMTMPCFLGRVPTYEELAMRMTDLGQAAASLAVGALSPSVAASILHVFAAEQEKSNEVIGDETGVSLAFDMVKYARLQALGIIVAKMPFEDAVAFLDVMETSRAGAIIGHMEDHVEQEDIESREKLKNAVSEEVLNHARSWNEAWVACREDDDAAHEKILDIVTTMHFKVAARLLCRAPAQRASGYLTAYAERDPAAAAQILSWMGYLTMNIANLSYFYLKEDVDRARALLKVSHAKNEGELVQAVRAIMQFLEKTFGVRCSLLRTNCDWDSQVEPKNMRPYTILELAKEEAAAEQELIKQAETEAKIQEIIAQKNRHAVAGESFYGEVVAATQLSKLPVDFSMLTDGDDDSDDDEIDEIDRSAAAVAVASDGVPYVPTMYDVAMELLDTLDDTPMDLKLQAVDELNVLATSHDTVIKGVGRDMHMDEPHVQVDGIVVKEAMWMARVKRAAVWHKGIFVVPVFNEHGIPVATLAHVTEPGKEEKMSSVGKLSYQRNLAALPKTIECLKLLGKAVSLATTAVGTAAKEERAKARLYKRMDRMRSRARAIGADAVDARLSNEEENDEEERLARERAYAGFKDERRKLGIIILEQRKVIRDALGEIKRYKRPPGVVTNLIVALFLSMCNARVVEKVKEYTLEELTAWVSGKTGTVSGAPPEELPFTPAKKKKVKKAKSGKSVKKLKNPSDGQAYREGDSLVAMQDEIWEVARTEIQLQYQHPEFILRKMQDVALHGDVTKISEPHLRAVLQGVTLKQAAAASDSCLILFKWARTQLAMIDLLRRSRENEAAAKIQAVERGRRARGKNEGAKVKAVAQEASVAVAVAETTEAVAQEASEAETTEAVAQEASEAPQRPQQTAASAEGIRPKKRAVAYDRAEANEAKLRAVEDGLAVMGGGKRPEDAEDEE